MSAAPFNKPFGQWKVRDITAPAFTCTRSIIEIIDAAPADQRIFVLAGNMSVISSLFKNERARQFIQAAVEAEK